MKVQKTTFYKHFIFIDAYTFFLFVDRQKIIDSCKKKM